MELDLIRKELNIYDNIIKNMITLRMALIPIVAKIKKENNLPLFQEKREEEIYKNIEKFSEENGVNPELIKNIYKLIISNALEIEKNFINNPESSIINKDVKNYNFEEIKENFEKLDSILTKDIPNILNNIKSKNINGESLTEKTTLYYNYKNN